MTRRSFNMLVPCMVSAWSWKRVRAFCVVFASGIVEIRSRNWICVLRGINPLFFDEVHCLFSNVVIIIFNSNTIIIGWFVMQILANRWKLSLQRKIHLKLFEGSYLLHVGTKNYLTNLGNFFESVSALWRRKQNNKKCEGKMQNTSHNQPLWTWDKQKLRKDRS